VGAWLKVVVCCLASQAWAQDPALPGDAETSTFGTTVVNPSGLRGDVYEILPGSWQLPHFEKLKPVGSIYTTSLNVPPQDFMMGFPGVTNRFEWFALDYKGKFWIEQPGKYRFALRSDDGSRLYIDDKLLINNDGIHAAQTEFGGVNLAGGAHTIRVSYFQGPRYQLALILAVSRPGERWRVFSTNEFKPPLKFKDWKYGANPGAALRDDDIGPDAAALAVLETTPLPYDFDFRLAAARFQQRASGREGVLVIEVPAKMLAATPNPARRTSRVHLSGLALVRDEHGQVSDSFTLDAPYDIPDAKLEEVQASLITYTHLLRLPPGRYTVEAAIIDHEGRRSSARVVEFLSPEPHVGIELSSAVLVQRVDPAGPPTDAADPLVYQGRRVVPLLADRLSPGMKPAVYFVVYPDPANGEKPKVQVEFLSGGRSLAIQTAELPPLDASGTIPMMVGAAIVPGDCELRITATQGAGSATESIRYSVAQ
jgi:hypothetical protein